MSISKTNPLASIALLWCLGHAAVVAAAGEPTAGNKVVEGIGWGGFKVGASRDELVKAFGPLEPTPGGQRTGWISRRHVDFWFDQAGQAVEVRFVKGFTAPLTSGIKIGSTEKQLLAAYGTPDNVVNESKSKKLEYRSRGVLMWVADGKVTSFTVFKPSAAAGNAAVSPLREKKMQEARKRMARDRGPFSQQELAEMESLTRLADEHFGTEEARKAMKTLVEKYKNANRSGCSLVYLGQMSDGEERITYFQQAITFYSDCFYGDGVQVGAFARFLLGQEYLKSGNADKAQALFEEIRKNYADAIDHRGRALVEQLPPAKAERLPATVRD